VARFLDSLALPEAVRGSSDLAGTPERVASAWLDELLDGYRRRPEEVLMDPMPSPARELVVLTGIEYHSMCPHHLLPSRGVAHLAYLPGGRLVGFGQLARLLDAFAHRLVLQEDLARLVTAALMEHLGARGAGCVLEAEHLCLSARGERQRRARAISESFEGALAEEGAARRSFLAAIARSTSTGSSGRRGKGSSANGRRR
jgi:GTP cyclohydrolase I